MKIPKRYKLVTTKDGHLDESVEKNRSDIDFCLAIILNNIENDILNNLNRIISKLEKIDSMNDLDPENVLKAKKNLYKSLLALRKAGLRANLYSFDAVDVATGNKISESESEFRSVSFKLKSNIGNITNEFDKLTRMLEIDDSDI